MKNRNSASYGFTLIEMLVVILIILLLSGMLFKIAGLVGVKAARGRAIADIANIEYALAEYYSVYDMYPPTTNNAYVYENYGEQPSGLQGVLESNNDPDSSGFIPDAYRSGLKDTSPFYVEDEDEENLGCEYGLVSYLYYRDRDDDGDDDPHNGNQPHWYDADTERDKAAKLKWQHFLEDLNLYPDSKNMDRKIKSTGFDYKNSKLTLLDPWGSEYVYECKPPYMKYKLWSKGPDRTKDTGDDINNGAFNE